jgi:tripartite-type tricarboxylate transporter receptor subunit TctC
LLVVSRVVFIAAYLLVCVGSAGTVRADWPDRPIRWVVPFGPGGANDLIARVTADAALAPEDALLFDRTSGQRLCLSHRRRAA